MQKNNSKQHLIPMIDNIIETQFLPLLSQVNFEKKKNAIIGLGSGSTVAELIKKMSDIPNKKNFKFIPTSLQIKILGENIGLEFTDESRINEIDLVVDGADQIDSKLNMIKGGGGALLKEKIIMYASKKKVILADSNKFVTNFNISIPIEVHPFARFTIIKKLQSITDLNQLDNYVAYDKIENLNGRNNISSSVSTTKTTKLAIRMDGKGYPFITENGNIIIDTYIPNIIDIEKAENVIKNIPGVLEVGLFPRKNDTKYYAVNTDGKFSIKSTT
ncbi:MAG TPA: ribose 5-phosphate isomerase A [Nitrososphaeraceae archaeon]|nr:ribose 5-phosphate isomerase A [Nitrososphaeraceae archaeon]